MTHKAKNSHKSHKMYCTFFVQGLFLGIEACKVQEVIQASSMTHVPLVHPSWRGLIQWRHKLLMAMDLRSRFELGQHEDETPLGLVVQAQNDLFFLIIDGIGDIVTLDSKHLAPIRDDLSQPLALLIQGMHYMDGKELLIVDLKEILDVNPLLYHEATLH